MATAQPTQPSNLRETRRPAPPPERERFEEFEEKFEEERRTEAEVAAGSTGGEALAGGAALVLAILGLSGIAPEFMAPIAAICAGAALLMQGIALGAEYAQTFTEPVGGIETAQVGGGMATEVLGGVAGITLGIIALVGVVPETLIACAAIVFGGTLLLGTAGTAQLTRLAGPRSAHPTAMEMTRQSIMAASGAELLVGVAAITLGILALVGIAVSTLNLVSMLIVGAITMVAGIAISARMFSLLGGRRR